MLGLAALAAACAAAELHSVNRSAKKAPARPEASLPGHVAHAEQGPLTQPSSPAAGAPETDERPSRSVELNVPGFEPAVLWAPSKLEGAVRPVLVVAHGAGGDARWHCELYRSRLRAAAYVLCPRGVRMIANRNVESGYYFPDHHELEREVTAALEALWSGFPDAARTGVVYAGYSQGATMGALMIVDHADVFTRLVLVEGGTSEWSLSRAREFRRRGGERVLFACGQAHCRDGARGSSHWLGQADVAVRVEYAPGAGHRPDGRVGDRVAEAFEWVTEGDPRWQAPEE
jgi:pimeloyl-ACP methyl ester carboxylesterase